MKTFYHSADLDGHCSGAIIKQKYPECEMIGIDYGHKFPWNSIKNNEVVYMVDFSLPFVYMKRLDSMCKLVWIDHHKTAIDEAHRKGFIANGGQLLEVGRAACELTWEYIYGVDTTPYSVLLLGFYDIWNHEDENVLPFQYGVRQFDDTSPENKDLWNIILNHSDECVDIAKSGRIILRYEKSQNTKECSAYAFETVINGFRAICINKGFCSSKIFDSVYDTKKHDIMITFVRKKLPAKEWKVSLYTSEDIDCGAIAKGYGGGGHKGAAGFLCDELPFEF